MSIVAFFRHGLRLLVPLAVACTIYLYLFPVFQGCGFPVASRNDNEAYEATKKLHWPFANHDASPPTKLAPFRLLALGDPQLEGDTSIITNYLGVMPHVKSLVEHATFQSSLGSIRERLRSMFHDVVDIVFDDIPYLLMSLLKRFDLWGNDYYLAHIYRTVRWWAVPTHVTVLGDLLGSQWIDDVEFAKRGWRFWNRSFKGGERIPDDVAMFPKEEYELTGYLNGGPEEEVWTKRIMNVAGNHDIGYAGDLTEERMERFERLFGKANYELRFVLPIENPEANATIFDEVTNSESDRLEPELRIIIVNDMNLDTPAKSGPLQDSTYEFINAIIQTSTAVEYKGVFTLILTHIPMHKQAGLCVDSPFFAFHGEADGGGVKEQNMLSADASRGFLEGIYGVSRDNRAPGEGRGRSGLMLNGHDHAGCDTFHYVNQTNGTNWTERSWEIARWSDAQEQGITNREGHYGRREITVRSMMGDFGGNAGLLSMWFNQETWEWQYEYTECPLGTQHYWWFVHFLDAGVILWIVVYGVMTQLVAAGVDVDAGCSRCAVAVYDWMRGKISIETNAKPKIHANGKANGGIKV